MTNLSAPTLLAIDASPRFGASISRILTAHYVAAAVRRFPLDSRRFFAAGAPQH